MSRKRSHEESSAYDLLDSIKSDKIDGDLLTRLEENHFIIGVFVLNNSSKRSFLIGPDEDVEEAMQKVPFMKDVKRFKASLRSFPLAKLPSLGTEMFRACDRVILDYEIMIKRSIDGREVEEQKVVASDSYTAVLEEMVEMAKVSQNNIVFSSIQAFPRGEWSKDAEELS